MNVGSILFFLQILLFKIYISFRPGLKKVLRELKEHFELILFTSSSKTYCDGILQKAIQGDDGEIFFDHKLFKNHLFPPKVYNPASKFHKDNSLIKNLDILLSGRKLSDILIVDNRSANYCDHVYNGIPISDYHGDPSDKALYRLQKYLMNRILPAEDVRKVIKTDFMDAVLLPPHLQFQQHHNNNNRMI